MRLDQYLVETNVFLSRAKAQDAILEGRVLVDGKVITKNSFAFQETSQLTIQEKEVAFASRAGYKLYDVLSNFKLCLKDQVCMDVGASTGGFSDVCLKEGAAFVYALDVGHDQLSPHLKADVRLQNMEGCNCRYLEKEMFDRTITFACMDVSFISITLILPSVLKVMQGHVNVVALIKPQFEVGKAAVGKQGIVKDEKVHIRTLQDMVAFVNALGYHVAHLQASSILGRDGNKEFVMHITEHNGVQPIFSYKDIVKQYYVKR